MWLEYSIWGLNFFLVFLIAARLQLLRTGVFTIGFFNVFTAFVPHYLFFPLYMLLTKDSRIHSEHFAEALVLVSLMLVSLLLGTLSTTKKTAPFYSQIKEGTDSLHGTFTLFIVVLVATLGLLSVIMKTANPFKLLGMARTPTFRKYYLKYNLSYPILLFLGSIYFLQTLLVIESYKKSKSFRSFLKGLFVTILAGLVMLSFASRAAFFTPLVIFAFVTHHLYCNIPTPLLLLLFIGSIPVFSLIRIIGVGYQPSFLVKHGVVTDVNFIIQEFIERFNGIVGVVDFLKWFKGRPFVFGSTILEFLLRPIPRPIFPKKPSSLDVFLSYEIYGRPKYGGGIMLFGGVVEMYYNYWFIGVIFWFFFLGNLLYRFHFGTLEILRSQKCVAAAMVISNYVFIRGLVNLGINTIAMQQLLLNIASQVSALLILKAWSEIFSPIGLSSEPPCKSYRHLENNLDKTQ